MKNWLTVVGILSALALTPIVSNAKSTTDFEITDKSTDIIFLKVPDIDFGQHVKTTDRQEINNIKGDTSLEVYSGNDSKNWQVKVSDTGFKNEKNEQLPDSKLLFSSGNVNLINAIGPANSYSRTLEGNGEIVKIMDSRGGTGTFELPFASNQIMLSFPETVPAGSYVNKLTWRLESGDKTSN